jgi:hypothetical protein
MVSGLEGLPSFQQAGLMAQMPLESIFSGHFVKQPQARRLATLITGTQPSTAFL